LTSEEKNDIIIFYNYRRNKRMHRKSDEMTVLKMINGDEIIGILKSENEHRIELHYPLKILQTYYPIDRWRPKQYILEPEDEDEELEDIVLDETQLALYELYSKEPENEDIEIDDYDFQIQQQEILFDEARRKKLVAFYHLAEWAKNTENISIYKSAIMGISSASDVLKMEYIIHIQDFLKLSEFQKSQIKEEENRIKDPINVTNENITLEKMLH